MTETGLEHATPELFAAISKAQAMLGHAVKDSVNPHFKSKYADLASVIDAAKPALAANNLMVIQTIGYGPELHIKTILGHCLGGYVVSYTPVLMSKQDAQGMGSAITYARRYAYAAIVGIAQEDDDGNAASKPGFTITPVGPAAASTDPLANTKRRIVEILAREKITLTGEEKMALLKQLPPNPSDTEILKVLGVAP